jgi:transcription antitermination factor NusA-like protein
MNLNGKLINNNYKKVYIYKYKSESMSKDIKWLSIKSNEMMRDTMKAFIRELKERNIEYESFATTSRIYIEIKSKLNDEDKKLIYNWSYYNPISVLNKKPNLDNADWSDW